MKNIKEFDEKHVAYFLIQSHKISEFRDESDLDIAKYHASKTIFIIEEILANMQENSKDNIIEFLSKVKKEIPKFYGKK